MVDRLAERLLPQRCRRCEAGTGGPLLCEPCVLDLPWNDAACARCALPMTAPGICPACLHRAPRFDAAWAAFRLQPPIQHGVHALKYHADFGQARLLGELMARRLQARDAPLPELLVPVPLHPLRLMRRGYNQAAEIARVIARACSIALDLDGARRVRRTEDQIGQSRAARRRNMRGAFVVRTDLAGRHVALVDDVMTTGATFDELARACRAAGAVRIEAWAAARTP
ncbi:ComF family protein [Sinimarinibacterium thermocellulolyticum]|uniref:ComF family protein n=1 Tax=Sinimarinibacterium thermocellulolyticum TaxID=3170016 RepID=A0ABV2ACH1_9GAMM